MITLYYQSGVVGEKWIPNGVPKELRTREAYKYNQFKSVKPKFITEVCDYLDIPVQRTTPKDYVGQPAFYHIEIDWIDHAFVYRNVFEHIDEEPLNLIRDLDSKLKLLLWFPNEGFSLTMPRFMEIIDFCVKDLAIPAHKVFLVFGDINIQKNFAAWRKRKGYSEINVYGMDSFEATYNMEITQMDDKPLDVDTFLNYDAPKSKRFIFKNANPRHQRVFFAAEFYKRDLLRHSYYSWLNRYFEPHVDRFHTDAMYESIDKYCLDEEHHKSLEQPLNMFLQDAPYIIDYDGTEIEQGYNQRALINHHYLDSDFSFVTETTYEPVNVEDVLFITEKIYQPIVNFHPFLVASQVNTLHFLRHYGYETFPELFDEEYDKITDIRQRSDLLLRNVQDIVDGNKDHILGSQYIKDKCVHNRNVFFEHKGKQKWVNVMTWLENTHAL
jgi:hypothetical protein